MQPWISDDVLPRLRTAPVTVGYSGGLDSTVLLHWLAASTGVCTAGLRAIHVHHGLHADADRWAAHCQEQCRHLDIPLRIVRVQVSPASGHGPEAAARHARREAFAAELDDGGVLALAHHRDDQAETFLLRALRASGPEGLAAMRPWRPFARGWLWRPLLDHAREELLAYARTHRLHWIDDPSNADTALDRNFLRHRILPALRERWPHADAAFARSATLSAEADELLAQEDARALAQARTLDPRVLLRDTVRALPAARRARVLRRWIEELGLPPLPAEGTRCIADELLDARGDADPRFAWHGAVVRAWRDLLHADRQHDPLPSEWTREWDGRSPLALPDGAQLTLRGAAGFDALGLDALGADGAVHVHARRGGERIVLPGRSHSHALKQVLQELGVPPWIRERLPLLSDPGGAMLAAGDLVYAAGFDERLRRHGARLVWLRDDQARESHEHGARD